MASSTSSAVQGLPNLKITVGNDSFSEEELSPDETEELGELIDQDSGDKNVEINRQLLPFSVGIRVYENKGGAFVTGLDLSSESLKQKLIDRANRFGLSDQPKKAITPNEINALYKSLDIDVDSLHEDKSSSAAKCRHIRLDTIHMRGVEEMSTNEVIDYFKDYGPASVEWINDFSCNVVWMDNEGAARALLGLSKVLVVRKKNRILEKLNKEGEAVAATDDNKGADEENDEEEVIFMSDLSSDSDDDDDDDKLVAFKHQKHGNPKPEFIDSMEVDEGTANASAVEKGKNEDIIEDIDVPVPPGHWRLGIPQAKAKAILLRFATKDDKKLPGAEKRSQYYQKYGNPNYGGLKGLITKTRKRKYNTVNQRQVVEQLSKKGNTIDFRSKNVRKPKVLRMRMCADDEEERLKRRAAKRQRIVESKYQQRSIHNRLGKNYFDKEPLKRDYEEPSFDDFSEEDYDDDEFRSNIKSTVSKPSSSKSSSNVDRFSRFNVWTRLAENMAQESEPEEFNYKTNPRRTKSNDLRERLHFQKSRSKVQTVAMESRNDLRSKLQQLRKQNKVTKHRSPLLIEIDNRSDTY